MEPKKLPITEEINRFKIHLDEEDNNRILFSGIFGIGKTYFIKKFFETEKDYLSITLNPVNYAVSPNQDIFELVKYDIAFQLFAQNPDFEKVTFDNYFTCSFFILENYKNIISNLIENLSKIDQNINAIITSTVTLGKQLEAFQKNVIDDDRKILMDFLSYFKNKNGTIREEDNISELLSALIEGLRSNNKKIVLVIDDLDRIDPEHIFRLLNVFSAHFDFQELKGENKFGFDKIILICDIENIRGIFHNKYGADIDFSGYIDKFYSKEIFYYRIENTIKSNLKAFLSSVKSTNRTFSLEISVSGSYINNELEFLLSYFIDSNALSLRRLLIFLNNEFYFQSYTLRFGSNSIDTIHSDSTSILFIIAILETLFDGKTNLLKAIDKVIDKYPLLPLKQYGGYPNTSIGNLTMIADYFKTRLIPSTQDKVYSYDLHGYTIEYLIKTNNNSYGVYGHATKIASIKSNDESTDVINYILPYFQLLKNACLAKTEMVKDFNT